MIIGCTRFCFYAEHAVVLMINVQQILDYSYGLVKPKTIAQYFAASLLSTQYLRVKTTTSRLGVRIMSGQHVYLQSVVSVSQHYKNPTKHVGLVQSGHHSHHSKLQLVLTLIQLKNCSFGAQQQSLTCFYSDLKSKIWSPSEDQSSIALRFKFMGENREDLKPSNS